jgi:hypothetical protein
VNVFFHDGAVIGHLQVGLTVAIAHSIVDAGAVMG